LKPRVTYREALSYFLSTKAVQTQVHQPKQTTCTHRFGLFLRTFVLCKRFFSKPLTPLPIAFIVNTVPKNYAIAIMTSTNARPNTIYRPSLRASMLQTLDDVCALVSKKSKVKPTRQRLG
jgi:hypothetical protein